MFIPLLFPKNVRVEGNNAELAENVTFVRNMPNFDANDDYTTNTFIEISERKFHKNEGC